MKKRLTICSKIVNLNNSFTLYLKEPLEELRK